MNGDAPTLRLSSPCRDFVVSGTARQTNPLPNGASPYIDRNSAGTPALVTSTRSAAGAQWRDLLTVNARDDLPSPGLAIVVVAAVHTVSVVVAAAAPDTVTDAGAKRTPHASANRCRKNSPSRCRDDHLHAHREQSERYRTVRWPLSKMIHLRFAGRLAHIQEKGESFSPPLRCPLSVCSD